MFLTTKLAAIGTLLLQWGLRLVLANHCKMLLSPNDALLSLVGVPPWLLQRDH